LISPEGAPNENDSHLDLRHILTHTEINFILGVVILAHSGIIGDMKNKELQKILGILFKAYIVYSISADVLVVGGIIYLIINGL